MIRVEPQPEPPDFDDRVRRPGLRALAENRGPLPAYWRRCLSDLHAAYKGVCAYVSIYIDKATGARTVEHYVAKSSDPGLACEWANYRLACSLVNSRKGRIRPCDDIDSLTDPASPCSSSSRPPRRRGPPTASSSPTWATKAS